MMEINEFIEVTMESQDNDGCDEFTQMEYQDNNGCDTVVMNCPELSVAGTESHETQPVKVCKII